MTLPPLKRIAEEDVVLDAAQVFHRPGCPGIVAPGEVIEAGDWFESVWAIPECGHCRPRMRTGLGG